MNEEPVDDSDQVTAPPDRLTFRILDGGREMEKTGWALPDWYIEKRDVPFGEMEYFDLAHSLRQELWPEQVAIVAVGYLDRDLSTRGGWYTDEVMRALAGLPGEFWAARPELRNRLIDVSESLYLATEEDDVLLSEKDLLR